MAGRMKHATLRAAAMALNPGPLDWGPLNRLVFDLEKGRALGVPGTVAKFHKRLPVEMANLRRQICELYPQVNLRPVPVNGSTARGLKAGYYMTRLADGSLGYFQRRQDDCLQAALASYLQTPPHKVPDLCLGELLYAGKDPEEVERASRRAMDRWTEKQGVTLRYHARPPTSKRRWIGVVRGAEADHCLLMSGRDCLFDPTKLLPERHALIDWTKVEIDYGITTKGD